MAELEQYKSKRNFKKTAEPAGGETDPAKLRFVVQKHDASHLHYDFRLEVKGVLKSWAVPRGPSMDPEERRLAMPVEDHPYDYKDFEGIIPAGQYGGGTVIVWDEGTYEPATDEKLKDKAAKEHWVSSNYWKNALKITLHGHKLKGDFILIKFKEDKYEGGWRLIKADDEYATKDDIRLKDKSVKSKLTIAQMADKEGAAEWQSNREEKEAKDTKETAAVEIDETIHASTDDLKKKGIRKAMPASVKPMLCTLTKEVVPDEDYLYEVKWDGYRIISYIHGKTVRMDSRSALDYTKKYPPVAKALKELGHDAVLDGEVVVFNEEGKPDFDALQTYNGHNTPINYCVFDLLWLDGYNLMNRPLTERKFILKELLAGNEVLRFSESFDDGEALYQQALDLDLEGIVAKRKDSSYVPDARDNRWLKTPTRKRQEFVIGGWAESDKSRSFRSLLFGAYNQNGEFEWIGRSGGGYKQSEMPAILNQLQQLEIEKTPFINKVLDTKGAKTHWVKPELVANFEFATWTKTGRIRKPATFLGFRQDKDAQQVVREVPLSDEQEQEIAAPATNTPKLPTATDGDSNWPKIEAKNVVSERDFEFGGHILTMRNIEQELWRGITKARLIMYYHSICSFILPHLKDRPLSLHIKQDGAMAPGFYIKDMEGHEPEYMDIFSDQRRHKKKGKRDLIDYAVCNNEAALLYLVNLGNIDLNPWSSRVTNPLEPDFISIDLDPSDEDFGKAIKTAQAAKKVFDQYKVQSLVKTSGKTGIHLFLPCEGFTYPQARTIAEKLCQQIADDVPDIATTQVSIEHRGTKLFVDPSQNDYADTLAAAYSVRPYKHPTVSAPLDWKEVKDKLDPGKFTMDTIPERLEKKGDLFKDLLNEKVRTANTKALLKL